ncbi:Wzz/FepE/Etk N-terminal domain-containing protein [Actinobacillus equuli subsp. haemolyticus]|uniref:LPS O-antigen chain length determinant protein WzzB n=1 Tax=Actinobacillus equuli TaxID=718 RepID=UPI0024420E42|nr:Wzz/FepE/Etk N-terminal domain-containing protein [Actinobacillus equuli]WGE81274.1 Wzz/FepE/Etk N-terminal domain-containing protein [Actinobacillus equuli subsp. haemolyticus]
MATLEQALHKANEEVELIELIYVLWKKKLFIAIVTLIFTALTAVYAFTAKEQWTSKTTVIAPKVADMRDYLSLRSEYANILDIKEFTSEKVVTDLFQHFKTALFSNNMKREFFVQSKWFQDYVAENVKDEEGKQKLLSKILEKSLIVTIPDMKKNPNALGISISFVAETPRDAQEVLTEYINFVNKKVLEEDKIDFLADIKIAMDNLELQKDKIQRDTESIRQVQVENLATALSIAKSAGIKEYAKMSGNISVPQFALGDGQIPFTDSKLSDGNYLFMLGEKYLQAQVDTLANNKVVYPVSFYTFSKQISLLNELEKKSNTDSKVSSYYYLTSPDYPTTRDWPKRFILLLVGTVFGGVLSCIWVLGKQIFSQK